MRSFVFLLSILFVKKLRCSLMFRHRRPTLSPSAATSSIFPKHNFFSLLSHRLHAISHIFRTKLKIATQNDLKWNDTTRSFCIDFYRRHCITIIICHAWLSTEWIEFAWKIFYRESHRAFSPLFLFCFRENFTCTPNRGHIWPFWAKVRVRCAYAMPGNFTG